MSNSGHDFHESPLSASGHRGRLRILDDEDDDPVLSSINLVDVFLVAIGILLVTIMKDPLRSLTSGDFTLLRDEGKPTMEIVVKQGETLTRLEATGSSLEGNGIKAGTAYKLSDGTMVYVPSKESDK
jgi:hypothetical protein